MTITSLVPRRETGDVPPASPTGLEPYKLPLSPARRQLAEHLTRLAELRREVEQLGKPVNRLRAEIADADQQLASARADLAKLDDDEAAAFASAAREGRALPQKSSATREKHLRRVELAERTKQALDGALRQTETQFEAARRAVFAGESESEPFLRAIAAEELDRIIGLREAARIRFEKQDATMRGLIQMAAARGRGLRFGEPARSVEWLRAAGAMSERLRGVRTVFTTPTAISNAVERWSALLDRLKNDAEAYL